MSAPHTPPARPNPEPAPWPEALFDVEPDLGAATLEPSLRQIIYKYYEPHFGPSEAETLMHRYVDALRFLSSQDAGDGSRPEPAEGELQAAKREILQWMSKAHVAWAEVERLREALNNQRDWHGSEYDSLGKIAPTNDSRWRRTQHKEQIDAIDAALSSAPATGGWMTIDSAPKDGTTHWQPLPPPPRPATGEA
ncbi:hypothetical protein [Enterovirga aerilata]|uniref:Uncharacterized protein n=1 Tax=Enterovirga aerilata TaxID=2730920 RepID=A0A849IFS7_9HYPH|nr:hypothetical protein [Enterovirga sp. DB1703]NNM75010.1 hypothetical protein [Enterovirga sp. DB1703]